MSQENNFLKQNFLTLEQFDQIIQRLATVMGVKGQGKVADILGVSPGQLSNVRSFLKGKKSESQSRNMPWDAILGWAFENSISVNWILAGEGPAPEKPSSNLDALDQLLSAAREKAAADPDFAVWLKVELKRVID